MFEHCALGRALLGRFSLDVKQISDDYVLSSNHASVAWFAVISSVSLLSHSFAKKHVSVPFRDSFVVLARRGPTLRAATGHTIAGTLGVSNRQATRHSR
jgi:hypothetical protein